MQRESILYTTDAVSVSSFLADFYVLSTFALLEYAIIDVGNIPAYSTFSSDANE
jgi:hypothetical protein